MSTLISPIHGTQFLNQPEGRIAYEVLGDGPLILCAPGMGDLRAVYRFIAPALADAGYRVALMDLRGHGDSDPTFTKYDDITTGQDLLALTQALGGPAILMGNSFSAGAAVWAATETPDQITGLVLLGPFVRDVPMSKIMRLAFRLALLRPWGRSAWLSYYSRLYPGHQPHDLAAHKAAIRVSLKRSAHWQAFVTTSHTSHAAIEGRLANVAVPSLVVMGTHDPDFPNPAEEAHWIAAQLAGQCFLVDHAGHYPQAEYPELVTAAILKFLEESNLAPR